MFFCMYPKKISGENNNKKTHLPCPWRTSMPSQCTINVQKVSSQNLKQEVLTYLAMLRAAELWCLFVTRYVGGAHLHCTCH